MEVDANSLLRTAVDHLEDRILKISDDSSQVAQVSELPPMTLLLKEVTVSNLKMRSALRKNQDELLEPIFNDGFIINVMRSLSQRHS